MTDLRERVPWDREAERAVLGAILLDAAVLDEVNALLAPGDFFLDLHRQAFAAMQVLRAEAKAIDAVTVSARMGELSGVDEVEVRTYVAELPLGFAATASARHHAEIVRRHALRRAILQASLDIAVLCRDETVPIEQLADRAERRLFEATERTAGQDLVQIGAFFPALTAELVERMKTRGPVTGLSTPLVDLDARTTGFHPGELIIVAARPGMGKTTLAMNFAVHAAVRAEAVVAVFSLEMPEMQLVQRIVASEAGVSAQGVRTGAIGPEDYGKVEEQCARLYATRLFIDGSSVLTASQIASKSRRLKSMVKRLDLVVVDYLQLMDAPSTRRDSSRAEDVAAMSRALKQLAKELSVPVMALAQLNREAEKGKRRPLLSDLRESGAIEQDADLVLFIHQKEEKEEGDLRQDDLQRDVEVELIIGKQRNGPVGTVPVLFQKRFNRFVNLDPAGGGA